MEFIYSKEELLGRLSQLRDKRDSVQRNRVAILEKYTRKVTQQKKDIEASVELYQIELQIEDVERRLSSESSASCTKLNTARLGPASEVLVAQTMWRRC